MGKEAGYLPPVQSVKQQVMNGTLLASGESSWCMHGILSVPFCPTCECCHVRPRTACACAFPMPAGHALEIRKGGR